MVIEEEEVLKEENQMIGQILKVCCVGGKF
jgi:hypothetical protein